MTDGTATSETSDDVVWRGLGDLRWSMERLADEALDRAGLELDPRGFIIGFPLEPGEEPIRIEPSRRQFEMSPLEGAMERAEELFAQHEDQALAPDEEEPREHYLAALLEGCRRQVVADALTEAARFEDRTVCVGISVVVGTYRVFPVLAVATETWESRAMLSSTAVGGLPVDDSFPQAVVNDVLRAASRELDRRKPSSMLGIDAGAILRSAADEFVNGVVQRTGQEFAQGARDALDAVSAQTYEGRASTGSVVLARREHPSVSVEVSFDHPTAIGVTRLFRKVLEMSGPGLHLLCDGREVYGLGYIDETYVPATEECFVAKVVGNGAWELWHGETPYLRVDHGQPALFQELMDPETFSDTVKRVFPKASPADAQVLWDMAQACARQSHGTMLVVHPDADDEAERLAPQAHAIEPTRLSPKAFTALTAIDGAALVSPEGLCHAVGVILDGAATGTGDGSRGARYNSAIRYLAGAGKGSMVIIVSEDGRIDLLPKLMRRVRRGTIDKAVNRLVNAAEDEEDYEKFARLDAVAGRLEFYFSQDQCDLVNEAREQVEQRRWTEERVRMQVVPIRPHPAMDDSYFIEPADA
ncbi:MAG: hypothetical protein LWW86_04175 [Micrococcales bacterium]|nr:hypothetical protein [Micrococcales bacterium]